LIFASVLALFSYSAFSHDLYNYIFDARIVTKYGQNPYLFKALDFPNDTWVRFMNWTHRTYPYGPLWLILTILPSSLGFEKFIVTQFLFKIFFAFFYLGSVYLIFRINQQIKSENPLWSVVYFALNPLVIIESLISPHVDISMTFFVLSGFYFLASKKNGWASLSFIFGALIKFLPMVLIPVIFLKHWDRKVAVSILIFAISLIPIVAQREFYSWYLVPFMAMASIFTKGNLLTRFLSFFSIGLILTYVPYLYFGVYDQIVWNFKVAILIGTVFMFIFYEVFFGRSPLHQNAD
jgi:Gpi18-like mannosyltransferase